MKKHNNGYFFLLDGKNGATYIFNIKNTDAVMHSLKFYKARSFKQKLMKTAFKFYLNSLGLFSNLFALSALKNKHEVESYLGRLINQAIDIDFNIDENSSILISPTRDKVIVHHHDNYFHKFAFGNSYAKVQNEAKIYDLLYKPKKYFEVSKMYDYENVEGKYCTFKLSIQRGHKSIKSDLVLTLVELFDVIEHKEVTFSEYIQWLTNRLKEKSLLSKEIEQCLIAILQMNKNVKIKLGLVHRDFKPWNVIKDDGLLIYDFEEAVTNGLPMEDLLNFYIDPIIRYKTPEKIIRMIYSEENINHYKRYLNMLGIKIEFEALLIAYLLERVLFWTNAKELETVEKYKILIDYICQRSRN